MAENWKLQVVSSEPFESWAAAARRLQGYLGALSESAESGPFNGHLLWENEVLSGSEWRDAAAVEQLMLDWRLRDDVGKLMNDASSSGMAQGYLGQNADVSDRSEAAHLVDLRWTIGWLAGSAGIDCQATFRAVLPEWPGRALGDHDPKWLVRLLSAAGAAIGADEGRIDTRSVFRALRSRVDHPPYGLGAVSLAPHGIPVGTLPDSMKTYPCPVGYPEGEAIVAELKRITTDPESLVNDLLVVQAQLQAVASR